MRRIESGELLDLGTAVQVGSRIGHVVSAAIVPSRPSGTVAAHRIRFEARLRVAMTRGGRRTVREDISPVEEPVSYVAIWVV